MGGRLTRDQLRITKGTLADHTKTLNMKKCIYYWITVKYSVYDRIFLISVYVPGQKTYMISVYVPGQKTNKFKTSVRDKFYNRIAMKKLRITKSLQNLVK